MSSELKQCPNCSQPMRVFLSYGHDSNEELVRRIKADLEKRGHDVWFDKSEIKAGDDWRRCITDGILKSDRVLSFLSKHSTRDPGVCRDEIAIAIGVKGGNIQTILVEGEQEVQPPVNISHIQWLDMHDWKQGNGVVHMAKEGYAVGDAAWEQWYQTKLAEIVRVVESHESRRFAGEIEALNGHLRPIKSDARICQLLSKGFCGRQWLFEAVEKWRQDTKLESRLFWIMGAPGVGKSAFAAQLTHTRGDVVIAAQFCEWDKPDHRDAQRVVRSFAFQLATRLPDYRKLLLTLPEIAELDRKDAAELFDYLLANPLRSAINGGRERHMIVIDALDEAGETGRNPLVEMLARNAQRLPDWLGLVVTSRPEFDVKTPLQALNPFLLDTKSDSNRDDIRDYLRRELASPLQNRPDADRLVDQTLEKSEGVFLYAERFCDDVQRGHLSLDRPEQFPQGLGGIFYQYFQRQFPDLETFRRDVRPALRAILAAREPLPVEILQRLFNWQDEELRDFTRPLASLFPVTTEAGHEVIKPYHKSLADWLTDAVKASDYFVSASLGHMLLADAGWRPIPAFTPSAVAYFKRYLTRHVAEAQQWERLSEMLTDPQQNLFQQWIEHGDLETGRFCLRAYLSYLTSLGTSASYRHALATQLARIEVRAGDLAAAAALLNATIETLERSDQHRLFAIAAHEYGSVLLEQGEIRQARAWYRRALRAARRQHPPLQGEIAANLVALATSYQVEQQFAPRVKRLAQIAVTIAQSASDDPHEIEAMRILADVGKDELRYDEAERNLAMGLAKARRLSLPYAQMALLAVQGWMQYQMAALYRRETTEAAQAFQQLATLAGHHRHMRFLADAWSGLGQCALLAHDAAGIARAMQEIQGLQMSRVPEHIRIRHMLLQAGSLQQQGKLLAAALAYQQALDAADAAHLLPRQADAHVGYGAVLWHLGAATAARQQWATAITLARMCAPIRRRLVATSICAARSDATLTPL